MLEASDYKAESQDGSPTSMLHHYGYDHNGRSVLSVDTFVGAAMKSGFHFSRSTKGKHCRMGRKSLEALHVISETEHHYITLAQTERTPSSTIPFS